MTESSDLVRIIDVLEAALSFSGDSEIEEDAAKVAAAFYRLSDANWDSLHEFLFAVQGRMEENVYGADWAAGIVIMAAEKIDPRQNLDTKARALGLASSMPFPPFRGDGTWEDLEDCWFSEMSFLQSARDSDWPLSNLDLAYMSDYARSAGGVPLGLFADDGLMVDPLGQLRIRLSGAGEVLESMTAVSLLASSSKDVRAATSKQLDNSGMLINPRLIMLFCDDRNGIPFLWDDIKPWFSIIETWKNIRGSHDLSNYEYLLHQLDRSTTWSLYADHLKAESFREDEANFRDLIGFLEVATDRHVSSRTSFSNQCAVLAGLWLNYRDEAETNEAWKDFFDYNDVGLPLAYMNAEGLAYSEDIEEAVSIIDETWKMFCSYIDINPDGEYESIEDAWEASSRPDLENSE